MENASACQCVGMITRMPCSTMHRLMGQLKKYNASLAPLGIGIKTHCKKQVLLSELG